MTSTPDENGATTEGDQLPTNEASQAQPARLQEDQDHRPGGLRGGQPRSIADQRFEARRVVRHEDFEKE